VVRLYTGQGLISGCCAVEEGRGGKWDKKKKMMMMMMMMIVKRKLVGWLVSAEYGGYLGIVLASNGCLRNSTKLSHCLSQFIKMCYVVIESLLWRRRGRDDNCMLANALSVSV
jgi:hypothetical protein